MKKFLGIAVAAALVVTALAEVRVVEAPSDIDGDLNITITDYSLLKSINGDVQVSGQTNAYTVAVTSYFQSGATSYTNSYSVASSANMVQGSESPVFFNYDADSSTGNTEWLKPGDILVLAGSTSTYYKVVFEKAD